MIKSILSACCLAFFLSACSGLEQSHQAKVREVNAQKEAIYRNDTDENYVIETPVPRVREAYPWESSAEAKFPRITKEFFRCKGSCLHPPLYKEGESVDPVFDCDGLLKHSLPVRGGKEFIYPILLDLLNYVQKKTTHKVVITCGHRCPAHNVYSDKSLFNTNSKHMLGAEVDFYVEGMEQAPDQIAQLMMDYFTEELPYKGHKEYEKFLRLESHLTNVSCPPWYNKEILIKISQKAEGRDFDNIHPYPYLSIQVRFDRDLSEKVVYSWDKAFKGFLRY
jgi:Bacterial protein of unknown function (DUF882)